MTHRERATLMLAYLLAIAAAMCGRVAVPLWVCEARR